MTEMVDIILSFIKNENGELNVLGKIFKIIVIFIIINIIISVIGRIIERTFRNKKITHLYANNRRANTLAQILKKTIKYILYFIGIVISLDMFGIKTGSIIATAGIGGLAIGFGAQSLVRDVITGFFILLEDQYAVGDYIKIASQEGVVEEIGLRVTKLRDFSGEVHIIPNGTIQIVTNKSRGAMRALVEILVPYEESADRIISIIKNVCEEMERTDDRIVEGPTLLGITRMGDYNMTYAIVAKTKAMEQWAVERDIRKAVKEVFDKEQVNLPYPKRIFMENLKDD